MVETPRSVTLFVTCMVDMIYPEIGEAVVAVLERLGIEVSFPADQTCCGQIAFNSGHWDEARAVAGRNIEVLRGTGDVVLPSGSCTTMLRHFYGELFQDSPALHAAALDLAGRTYEFTEYIVDVLKLSDVGGHFEGRLTVHDACHGLRGLGIREQPRALLAHVAGASMTELGGADECCGFGGLFSIKLPGPSSAMLQRKVDQIEATGADAVVMCDASCMTQINGRLSRTRSHCRAMHVAQVLAGDPDRSAETV